MLRKAKGGAVIPRATSKAAPLIERTRHTRAAPEWTFLTNHFHVLVSIWTDPLRSLREIALLVGITERSAQRIVADLENGGYLERERVGRSNRYVIRSELPLRHPLERGCSVAELLALVQSRNS